MKNNTKYKIKFLFMGILNTVVCLYIYDLLIQLKYNYIFASIISYILGILLGYFLNSLITFNVKLNILKLLTYSIVCIISLLFNVVFVIFFVKICGVDKFVSQVLTAILMALINYFIVKIIVFKI